MTDTTSKKAGFGEEVKKNVKKDLDIELMFRELENEERKVPVERLMQKIKASGIIVERDKRFKNFLEKLFEVSQENCFKDTKLTYEDFYQLVEPMRELIKNCMTDRLKLIDFRDFSQVLEDCYEIQKQNISGTVCKDLPVLANADINKWTVCACSVDGQRKFSGDSSHPFTMQNICKPILLGLALKQVGKETIKKYISFEPSNKAKDVLQINEQGKPLNPMVDTGAIMTCAIISSIGFEGMSVSHINETYTTFIKKLAADEFVDFKSSAYISKKEFADDLRCLAYGLKCSSQLPRGADIDVSLDLYLKASSIEVNAESLSVMAATLANGGVNPFTEERILLRSEVREILSAMFSYGLYDLSGEGSFYMGLPMKSSMSGGLMVVVPRSMGLVLYSPLLNSSGVSNRSYQFCKDFVKSMKIHHYDTAGELIMKRYHDRKERWQVCQPYCELLTAAANNDEDKLANLKVKGYDFYQTDLFGHNALHVAAARGAFDAVKYILKFFPSMVNTRDKWDRTPKRYALEKKYFELIKYLERYEN